MRRAWIVAVALLGVVFSAPLLASDRASAASTTGTVQIVYPLNGAALGIEGTRVQLSVSNFVLDPNNLPCVATDHGRIRLYVNDTFVQETSNSTTSLPSLAPTDIKLGAQLVCTDSSSFTPQVWHNITISVGEPTVKISNPGRPLAVSTAGVRIAFSVTRFALDPANYAGPRVPGAGHVHILRNGTFIGTSTTPFADLAGVLPGPLNLTIELHNNDHSLLVTSTHPFGYNDTIAATTVVPSVRIVSPANLQTVSASGFRVTVSVAGIELDSENYGGAKIPGHGHLHYYLDGSTSLAATSSTPFVDFGPLAVGAHSIKAELHNNDHSLYTDAAHSTGFNTSVTVTVATTSISILSPANNAAVSNGGFRISMAVAGLVLDVENYGGTNIPGHGHIHVYEGGSLLGTTTTTWFDATLGTGDHTLRVELRNNDHTPLSPAVSAQITVHVGPPELKILEPVAASSVSALGFRMRFVVSNFTLDSEDYGGVAIPGAGHIHVYHGTTLLTTTVSDHVVITGLPTGGTTLRVELHNNDHSLVVTSTHPFGFNATIALTVVTPSIALTAPSSITAGEDLRISWAVTGFVLDSAAFGGTPEAGRGHVHVFVDGTYTAATPATSFVLTGIAAGSHNISVELYNNDHSELTTEYSSQAIVTVSAPAPAPAGTVATTVFYGSVGVLAAIIVVLAALLARKGRKGPPKSGNPEGGDL